MSRDPRFDVIVVGSGAGGAACASRLAAAGRTVLVLEKGPRLPDDGSTLDPTEVVVRGAFVAREAWRDGRGQRVVPEEHFNVGGKTRWYGAALLRFGSDEFGPSEVVGSPGWPLPLAALEPFYEEAERCLGVREFDPEPDLLALLARLQRFGWHDRPLPMALRPQIYWNLTEATHFDGFASVAGLKHDAVSAFLQPALASGRARLEVESEVVELLGEPAEPRRIVGVRTRDGREHRAPSVVLCAGALHSPRLLQTHLARAGLLGAVAPEAGRRLKLHHLTAVVAVTHTIVTDVLRKTRLFEHPAFPHSTVQPLGFGADVMSALVPAAMPRPLARAFARRAYGFFLQTEDGSDSANCVHEPVGGERVLDYAAARTPATAREHAALVATLRGHFARLGIPAFARPVGLQGTAHACGTLAAGHDASAGVVDAGGRVHGMSGLYVADGSVLPRSGRVNPALTIAAWGLRVGAMLAAQRTEIAPPHEREVRDA